MMLYAFAKKYSLYLLFWLTLNAVLGCNRLEIERITKLITKEVSIVSAVALNATGEVLDIGDPLMNHGHCWATHSAPSLADSSSALGNLTTRGVFTTAIGNLEPDTRYYVRAYVQTPDSVIYGEVIRINTPETTPPPITLGVSNIGNTEAEAGGFIKTIGKSTITQHGHCWATTPAPTVGNSRSSRGVVSNKGAYSSTLSGLQPGTLYYVRSYAQSIGGISYGNQTTFRTAR